MRKKRVSIVDLARELNISPSTVSRALRNEEKISLKTRKKVHALAQKLGYRPNNQARSLLKQRTYTVGLVVPDFVHPFFSIVLKGIESVMTEVGFQLIICTSEGDPGKEQKVLNVLLDSRVDGLLISLAEDNIDLDFFLQIQKEGVPLVFIDRRCEDIDASYVITDEFQGAMQAVEHLIGLGRKKIGHVKGPENLSTSFQRFLGYRECLRKHNIPLDDTYLFQSRDDKGEDLEDVDLIKAKLPELDGLFVYNDYVAYEIMHLANGLGIKIPEELAVVGYGNDPFGRYAYPPLTTVDQQALQMGVEAARILIDQIYSDLTYVQPKLKILPTSLVVRGSS